MKPERYGQEFNNHLLEQYKLYVAMADNLSTRRSQTNQFYVSVLSALLGLIAISTTVQGGGQLLSTGLQNIAYPAISLLGSILCVVWFINIYSYRQLNTGKFKVIHEMEQSLPYACYDREWVMLGEGKEVKKYLPLTHIEQYVPVLLAIPFIFFLISFLQM